MAHIEFRNVSKVYNAGKPNEVKALDHVSFAVEEREFAVILGASGAGKSTLLNILGGMDRASEGHYFLDGEDVVSFDERRLSDFRRNKIGFVFQFYNLMPNLTALENVALAASLKKDSLNPEKVLSDVGLSKRAKSFPGELSGGEQQRVSIARAIVKNPTLLLCDEPTGALDSKTGESVLSLLRSLAKDYGKTVLVVTHNRALSAMADHLLEMRDGKIFKETHNAHPLKAEEIAW